MTEPFAYALGVLSGALAMDLYVAWKSNTYDAGKYHVRDLETLANKSQELIDVHDNTENTVERYRLYGALEGVMWASGNDTDLIREDKDD